MRVDAQMAFDRARWAYERGRSTRAATFALPLAGLAVVAACLGTRPVLAIAVGASLVVASWFFLWRGQILGRAVFPGLLAGLVPLALAFAARSYGHVCMGGECTSLCVPACALGGFTAGLVIVRAGRNVALRLRFYAGAGLVAALVGALGCSCVGFGGVASLGFGLLSVFGPSLVRRA